MPDGKRKRRHSSNEAKRRWYALHRARRFKRRFWNLSHTPPPLAAIASSHITLSVPKPPATIPPA